MILAIKLLVSTFAIKRYNVAIKLHYTMTADY